MAPKIDAGDTAWLLVSCALVLLMTPGLALFYGGMVQRKNVLATMMYGFAALPLVTVEWAAVGYSMAFGQTHGGIIGGFEFVGLSGLAGAVHGTVPALAFATFQMMFAIITPALIAGAFAERMRFSAYVAFTLAWSVLVYNPCAHWVWAEGGWLMKAGALDFAGGTVVHATAGVSALVGAIVLKARVGYPRQRSIPHNMTMTVTGAGLLWFGWFGFNAGSALTSGSLAALALTTTHLAGGAGALTWMIAEWAHRGKATAFGVVSGLVAGLVAITPGAGYVSPLSSLIIGAIAAPLCYAAVLQKDRLGYDDALDAFGVHGVGGIFGALCTGLFADKRLNDAGADGAFFGNVKQLGTQALGVAVCAAYAAVVTFVILKIIDATIGLRVPEAEEREGLDTAQHGEEGYALLRANPSLATASRLPLLARGRKQRAMPLRSAPPMTRKACFSAFFALSLLAASGALAQPAPGRPVPVPARPGPPMPPELFGHRPMAGRGAPPDCVVTAVTVSVHARRSAATADAGFRLRGVKGGACSIRPEAVRVSTRRGSAAQASYSVTYVDGQAQRPVAVADASPVDMPPPWSTMLGPGEERAVVVRLFVDGDALPNGDIDPPAAVRIDMRAFGPRVLAGAPLDARVALEPGSTGRVGMSMGTPTSAVPPQTTSPNGSLQMSSTLGKDELFPSLEWRYEPTPPPAVTASAMAAGGLGALEYLRDGLVRNLAEGLSEPRDAKRAAAAWDASFASAFDAARSSDPLVAGLGERTFAWLASGLAPGAVEAHAPGATAKGDTSVAVPEPLAGELAKALASFTAATGQAAPPSPIGARSIRSLLIKLGEPGTHKREADDALRRFVKLHDAGKTGAAAGAVLSVFPLVSVPAGAAFQRAKVVAFGPRGGYFEGTTAASASPREPLARRVLATLSDRHRLARALVWLLLFGGGGAGLAYYLLRRDARPSPQRALSAVF